MKYIERDYRKRDGLTRIYCPHQDYDEYWVEVPEEWTIEHQIRYQEAFTGVLAEELPGSIAEVAGALALCEDFYLPNDVTPEDMSSLYRVPTPVLTWLRDEVISDYLASWNINPKEQEESSD